eukprot:scaffold3169_cov107-Cylindrotheca_fusiformis.AAC.3
MLTTEKKHMYNFSRLFSSHKGCSTTDLKRSRPKKTTRKSGILGPLTSRFSSSERVSSNNTMTANDFEVFQTFVGSSMLSSNAGEESSSICLESSETTKPFIDKAEIADNMGNNGLYTGTVVKKTSIPHGEGTMEYFECNMIYTGQWVQGDWSGFGRLTDTTTGLEYEGGFFDNHKHGLGIVKYPDGRVYDTSFQLGKMSGKGHISWPDGSKYWGHWNGDGIPHGRGKQEFSDGRVYDGEFEKGVVQGHGRMTWPDGSWHLGEWMDGVPNGLGMRVGPDGALLEEGMYCHGEALTVSSLPPTMGTEKSSGEFLLYRSSMTDGRTLEGPLPSQITMRKFQFKC